MNPFNVIHVLAREQRLPGVSAELAAYYASPAFRERSQLTGPSGTDDATRVLLFMLQHVAVDPRDDERNRVLLSSGFACLGFWGVSNPVPAVTVVPGSDNHKKLLAAYDANRKGPFARALTRVRRRRAQFWQQSMFRDAMARRFYDALPWPTAAEFKANSEQAKQNRELLAQQYHQYKKQLVDRYASRMAILSHATCPQYRSWTDLIQGIALNVFLPPST